MQHLVISAVASATALVLAASALVLHRMTVRGRTTLAGPRRLEPRSVVRLITTEEELREAIERASRFERQVAEALEHRATHYESLLPPPPLPGLRPVAHHGAAAGPAEDPTPPRARRARPA